MPTFNYPDITLARPIRAKVKDYKAIIATGQVQGILTGKPDEDEYFVRVRDKVHGELDYEIPARMGREAVEWLEAMLGVVSSETATIATLRPDRKAKAKKAKETQETQETQETP